MLGKGLIAVSALSQLFGPFLADFNHTHVLNPNWPPHAKFHNGQTMSMGVCLCFLTLYLTFAKNDLFTAAMTGSLYWITGLSAILYPGSKGIDPEFGEGFPQVWLFVALGVMTWAGWWLES